MSGMSPGHLTLRNLLPGEDIAEWRAEFQRDIEASRKAIDHMMLAHVISAAIAGSGIGLFMIGLAAWTIWKG